MVSKQIIKYKKRDVMRLSQNNLFSVKFSKTQIMIENQKTTCRSKIPTLLVILSQFRPILMFKKRLSIINQPNNYG